MRERFLWITGEKILESTYPPASNAEGRAITNKEAYKYLRRILKALKYCYYERGEK